MSHSCGIKGNSKYPKTQFTYSNVQASVCFTTNKQRKLNSNVLYQLKLAESHPPIKSIRYKIIFIYLQLVPSATTLRITAETYKEHKSNHFDWTPQITHFNSSSIFIM